MRFDWKELSGANNCRKQNWQLLKADRFVPKVSSANLQKENAMFKCLRIYQRQQLGLLQITLKRIHKHFRKADSHDVCLMHAGAAEKCIAAKLRKSSIFMHRTCLPHPHA